MGGRAFSSASTPVYTYDGVCRLPPQISTIISVQPHPNRYLLPLLVLLHASAASHSSQQEHFDYFDLFILSSPPPLGIFTEAALSLF